MSKTINYSQVSASLSAKERAKLVTKLGFQGMNDVYPDPEKQISTFAEIKKVVAACPSEQAKEYNFLIALKDQVWSRLIALIELTLLELEVKVSRFHLYVRIISREDEDKDRHMDTDISQALHDSLVKKIAEIADYKGVIEKIQQEYFDGMPLMGDGDSPLATFPKAEARLAELVSEYNFALEILNLYQKLGQDASKALTVQLKDLSEYYDPEIINKQFGRYVQNAQENS